MDLERLLDWRERWRYAPFRLFAYSLTFVAFACGGDGCGGGCIDLTGCSGGCTSCSSCEGCALEPLPEGFPIEDRIDDAAHVRLTAPGLAFLEENVAPLLEGALPDGLTVPIPRTEFSLAGTDYTLCPDEDCFVQVEVTRFQLDPGEPNRLNAEIDVVFDGRDPAGDPRALPLEVDSPVIRPYICDVTVDSRAGDRDEVGLVASVALNEETRAPRQGYTRIDIPEGQFADEGGVETADLRVSGCILGPLFNSVRPILIGEVEAQIGDILAGTAQPCTAHVDGACPGDTFARGDACRYEDDDDADCVPMPLGVEGRLDLGGLLGSFSPGTGGDVRLLLAAAHEGEADDGMNVRMYGGIESEGHDSCVPVVEPPPIPEIPIFEETRTNATPGGAESHVNVAIAEAFLDYAGYAMFDTGALCLGVGTPLAQELSSGTFSLVAMSLRELTFPETTAPIAIALRPQQPPDFTVGTSEGEPLLTIALPELAMDFYVFSSERYVRFMTFTSDVSVGLNLEADAGAIAPRIEGITAADPVVTNSELLTEDPETLASSVATVLETFAGMIAGAIDPIALPELAGLRLEVPEGGFAGLTQDEQRALGLFATLSPAGPAPHTLPVQTSLRIEDVALDPASHTPARWNQVPPRITVVASAEGPLGVAYEYAVRVDGQPWSRWQREPRFVLEGGALLLQAKHTIEARARVADEGASVDPTPAWTHVLVDFEGPIVHLHDTAEGLQVDAEDVVSGDALEVRVEDGAWLPYDAGTRYEGTSESRVEVRDEAGNVTRVGGASQELIRGRPNPGAAGGCDCRVGSAGGAAWPLLLVLLAGRRRRS